MSVLQFITGQQRGLIACFVGFYNVEALFISLLQVFDTSGDLQRYYDACSEYWQLKQELMVGI